MWMRIAATFLLCQIVCSGFAEQEDLWAEASQLYRSAEYDAAASTYESWIGQGNRSFAAYYNLGNSYYQLGETAKAILAYRRAKRFKPHHNALQNNLVMAQQRMTESITPVRGFFVNRWIHTISFGLSTVTWTAIFLSCLWTGIGLAVLRMGRLTKFRPWKWSIWGMFGLALVAFLLGLERYVHFHETSEAVVMQTVDLKVAPDPQSADVRGVPEGAVVFITDSLEQHYKVRLQNYEEGWLQIGSLERVRN